MKTILVGVDGSEPSKRAVELAAELGAKFEATLVLAYVLPSQELIPPSKHGQKVEKITGKQREFLQAVGAAVLEDAAAEASRTGAPVVEREIPEGDAVQVLLDVAKAKQADLIVLGSRGMSPIKGVLIGSVSQKVLTMADCPCLIVK